MSVVKSDVVTKKKPEKSLLAKAVRKFGRSHGKISVRHKGGGHKRRFRIVDFRQQKAGVEGRVAAIEKDPNRSALLALVHYVDGDKRYVLASDGMQTGSTVMTAEEAPIAPGNRLKLKNIPAGYTVSNVELTPGKGGQLMRSAGTGATLMGVDGAYAQLKLASGEVRRINKECFATVGSMGNSEHNLKRIGKAGKGRWLGRRPTVRGTVMNPVDHPHGGGEGRQPI